MGFNQAPQQKQVSQRAPQGPTRNPYQQASKPASTSSLVAPQVEAPNTKKTAPTIPASSPVEVPVSQRGVSTETLQGGVPSGGGEVGGGPSGGFTPDMGNRRMAAMTAPSRAPSNADYNRSLTDAEYQGVLDRERAWSPNAGSTYSGPTLGQAMDQYGGGSAGFTLPNGAGEQVDPLGYLKRNPYSHQGRFARLPGTEMEKWKNGTYKG